MQFKVKFDEYEMVLEMDSNNTCNLEFSKDGKSVKSYTGLTIETTGEAQQSNQIEPETESNEDPMSSKDIDKMNISEYIETFINEFESKKAAKQIIKTMKQYDDKISDAVTGFALAEQSKDCSDAMNYVGGSIVDIAEVSLNIAADMGLENDVEIPVIYFESDEDEPIDDIEEEEISSSESCEENEDKVFEEDTSNYDKEILAIGKFRFTNVRSRRRP